MSDETFVNVLRTFWAILQKKKKQLEISNEQKRVLGRHLYVEPSWLLINLQIREFVEKKSIFNIFF